MTREIEPLTGRLDAVVPVPGSKSISNRALLIASLARGESEVLGTLHADDTAAMVRCLTTLGAVIERHPDRDVVTGVGGAWPACAGNLDVGQAATVARFLLPSLLLGQGSYVLDGHDQMKSRPMGPLIRTVSDLGLTIQCLERADQLPLRATAPASAPVQRQQATVTADMSSQFLSGLLMAGPCLPLGLELDLKGHLVSRPYIQMTLSVMRAFGAQPEENDGHFIVPPTGYSGASYRVEPDASAASYFFGAAAICGGRVRVDGLTQHPLQGDIAFVRVLEKMGATVRYGSDFVEVSSDGHLRGIEAGIDMADFSDTAQTLAAVAVFAEGPTRIHGIGFIQHKETNRVRHVVEQLRACGIDAHEEPDGFLINPSQPQPARINTYGDHRMAMSFSLLGLKAPGIVIEDDGCVSKTFPTYWDVLEAMRP